MILVEGDTFSMGKGDAAHDVYLDNFYIGKYPVTQALWKAVMGADKNPSHFKGDNRPVERVSWDMAEEFVEAVKEKTGKPYRLPTEAEWEFAARGGRKSEEFEYAGSNVLKNVAWYNENSYGETKPVGWKTANELGIHDMSGNVWEWCEDWYGKSYYEVCKKDGVVNNPKGPKKGTYRVLRGGGWITYSRGCRATYRFNIRPDYRHIIIGFRLVFSLQSVG